MNEAVELSQNSLKAPWPAPNIRPFYPRQHPSRNASNLLKTLGRTPVYPRQPASRISRPGSLPSAVDQASPSDKLQPLISHFENLIGTPIRLETRITPRKQRVGTSSDRYTFHRGPTKLPADFSARSWRDTGCQPLLTTYQLPPSGAHSLTKPLNATYNESSSIQLEAACTL